MSAAAATGKHYNYFRDYDPAIGRYIQSDPTGVEDGPNTYGYVGGDALGWIDPTGLARGRGSLPNTDDCKPREQKECEKKCAPKAALGCYVTVTWKARGLRNGNLIRSEERSVNCRCDDGDGGGAFSCDANCQKKWKLIRDAATGAFILVLLCVFT